MRPFYVFSRWGEMLDTIARPLEAIHTDTVNGEDSLSITALGVDIQKGDRIVWQDKFGTWHEHQVADTTQVHSDEGTYLTAYCENSIAELLTDYIVEVEPRNATSTAALTRALEGSTWGVGPCDTSGTASFSWYHTNAYDAISEIVETFDAELVTDIELHGTVVSERTVAVVNRCGADNGQLFTYGRHLQSVERTVSSDDVITALYGYGKGIQKTDEDGNATGGYSRKLTFGDVNGGRDWVGDDEARLRWGYPDGHGGVKHTFGQVEFSDCEDPDELLKLTKAALDKVKEPKVTYTVSLINLGQTGVTNGEDLRKGDTVNIRDIDLDLRLSGRVLQVKRDLLDESGTEITLGNLSETLTGNLKDRLANLDWLQEHMGSITGMEDLGATYLQAVIDRLNEEINMTGGYTYWVQGDGITTYDKPIDQNPTMVIQIKGGSFRIANKKKSNGEWDYRTFGTGDGFVADELITGTIKGGANYWNLGTGDLVFKQGQISSADGKNSWNLSSGDLQLGYGRIHSADNLNSWDLSTGDLQLGHGRIHSADDENYWNLTTGDLQLGHGKIQSSDGENFWNLSTGELQLAHGYIHDSKGNNYWNLDTGELKISAGTKVGSQTLSSYVQDQSSTVAGDAIDALEQERLTQQAIFNTLTGGGSTQGIYLQGGRVYINASYIGTGTLQAGKIQDKQGNNYWDLDKGELKISASSTVESQTLSNYVQSQSSTVTNNAIDALEREQLTQQAIFNKLTGGGSTQGIYLSGGKVYINASYIGSGTVSAAYVKTGILADSSGNVAINLNTGKATLKDIEASGTFSCGTANNGLRLTSTGRLSGYRNGSEVGTINYLGQIQRQDGSTVYGLKVTGGTFGFDVGEIYTGSYRGLTQTSEFSLLRNAWLDGDGKLNLSTGTLLMGMTNGICTHLDII